jgi:hypothetical protein
MPFTWNQSRLLLTFQVRLYSREASLGNNSIMFTEYLPSPVVFIGPSGEDSLLVYTYDNILYHYIINSSQPQITLVPVGQIAFNGIVRAPTRVRSISWVLPEEQMREFSFSSNLGITNGQQETVTHLKMSRSHLCFFSSTAI